MNRTVLTLAAVASIGMSVVGAGAAAADSHPVANISVNGLKIVADLTGVQGLQCQFNAFTEPAGTEYKLPTWGTFINDPSKPTAHFETVDVTPGQYQVTVYCWKLDHTFVTVEQHPANQYGASDVVVKLPIGQGPAIIGTVPSTVKLPKIENKIDPTPPVIGPPTPVELPNVDLPALNVPATH
ncbi:hypothetical protein MINS_37720 [Mycolicibacterium insubricum]|uniref:hypothetical protein n=1 Tax=Mycolicibacterium insubricum TaxID=444597 RepID=UPI00105460D1|nr:hypothetical protein [Mycolicibacterium insubricum]MCB0928031.1 hypothetical protein [Mycobacterium sp.]MCV7081624.1 hypothetical protein [Mycolicibacterium insubricum]BBZ68343.1 hypothetical protein MINS_37720 [Mycolicibacterium insubricum]